jgi:DNA-binding response OmpR family regulator
VFSNRRMRSAGVILAAAHDVGVLRAMCCLRNEGYRVLAACDGEQALDVFSYLEGEIDLALIDLDMPGIGGLELMSSILAVRPDTNILVVHQDDKQSLSRIGTPESMAICKPFIHHELLREVRFAAHGGRRALESAGSPVGNAGKSGLWEMAAGREWKQTAAGAAGA